LSENRRRLVPEDFYQFMTVGDPRISPDGELVAFVRTQVDPESKEPHSSVWVVPTDGSRPPARYTSGKSDSSPRWSPDGRLLAFLREPGQQNNHNGTKSPKQLWLIDRTGGEAWQLTTLKHGAGPAVWSPDVSRIAFEAGVRESDARDSRVQELTESGRKDAEKEKRDRAGVYSRMRWRFDPLGIPPADRFTQIWYVDVPHGRKKASSAVQVTWGEFSCASPAWSPDGRLLAFISNRSDDDQLEVSDLFLTAVPAADAGAESFRARNLTGGSGIFTDPVFSPDGKWLAAAGHRREYRYATFFRMFLFPLDGSDGYRVLNEDWDMEVGEAVNADLRPGGHFVPVWAPESNVIYVSSEERGRAGIYALNVAGGPPRLVIGGDREIYGASFDTNLEHLAFVATDLYNPGEIYSLDLKEFEERRLTEVNRDLLASLELPAIEEITYRAPDGWEIHGWLMKPVGFAEGEQYPLVLQVHGGPHTCWGCAFHFEIQLMAASGYGVLFVNPRGSTSYGQKFANAVRYDYGGKDYLDLMAGVDFAIAQGWVDPVRVGITGGSYGGFMTNWAVGQTDRFAAAITHRSISNWLNFAGVSDIGPWFVDAEHGVTDPWSDEGYRKLWEISPIRHASRVRTPLQIMHAEFDFRCPVSEAEQFFMAIKFYKQAPTELIRHPRSNHDLTRLGPPVLRVDRFQHILRWLRTYMPPNA
jgi:dipeptidyl aminopeptidase/acylaminoacyl peptidase